MQKLIAFALLGLVVVACGDGPKAPAATPSNASDTPSPPPTAAALSSSAPAASAEPESPHRHRPLEIYNSCTDVVTVVFGENPKDPKAGSKTIAASSAIDGARDNDGNLTVWLLDTNAEPLVKVHVTRGMKRVEIGRSCRTLDAR